MPTSPTAIEQLSALQVKLQMLEEERNLLESSRDMSGADEVLTKRVRQLEESLSTELQDRAARDVKLKEKMATLKQQFMEKNDTIKRLQEQLRNNTAAAEQSVPAEHMIVFQEEIKVQTYIH